METVLEAVSSPSAICIHHWLIETQSGSVSRGKCKLCGASRDFRNEEKRVWVRQSQGALAAAKPGRQPS